MKLNRLESHDRLLYFKKDQNDVITKGLDDCLRKNPLSIKFQQYSPYIYIFMFPNTLGLDERYSLFQSGKYSRFEDVPTTKIRYFPCLRKPTAQSNSHLFRAISHTDLLEPIWQIPPEELWEQYKKYNMTAHAFVLWSIDMYTNHRPDLQKPFEGDLSREQTEQIWLKVAAEMDEENRMKKLYGNH